MRSNTQLDYAVFQLNPTRTRCELHIAAQGMTYKLASGLLKPFVAHLSAIEEQIAGGGYSIRLEPPDPGSATWFTKGTMERFVRFVSTPEVLERVSSVELELIELEETIRVQANDASEDNKTAEDYLSKLAHVQASTGGMAVTPANPEKPAKESLDCAETGTEDTTKQWLLGALDARWTMLQKEQAVAFARAIAAGFSVENTGDLMLFAESFGAIRLREACTNFMALCKKRQESGLWQEDLKLAAAEIAQADMAFSDNVVNYMGSREHSDLQGRGLKHDDARRASLPNEGRLLMGDSGLEKLTRRGSLDELTGEFWQVAARMRSSGMMEGVNADWSSNWQTPMSGRNQLIGEEMQSGVGYLGANSELQDSESLVRGHPMMPAAWQGQPQNHFMHNVHPLSLHRPMHPSLPPSLGILRPPQPGLPYPPYLGNPYVAQAYAEANNWQMPPPVPPPPYWPGHLGYNGTPAPTTNEHGDEVPRGTQNEGTEPPLYHNSEAHGEQPDRTQRPASGGLADCTQRPASGLLVSKETQETVGTQKHSAVNDDQDHDTRTHDVHGEPHAEMTRRTPIRSSSPSRRSASPLRKVQIGRSGSKRSGTVAIRNINYITHSTQNQAEGENNDSDLSENWSDDNEDGKSDEESKVELKAESKVEPVRARVQDVIGLFESKKDSSNDTKGKPLTKESKRLPSKNIVLRRWTESGALERDAGEAQESLANNGIRRGVSGSFAHDVAAEMDSKQPNVSSKNKEERASLAEEDVASSRSKDTYSTALLGEQGQNVSIKMVSADDSLEGRTHSHAGESRMLDEDLELASEVGSCSEQPISDDSFIVFERRIVGKEARKMPLNLESEMRIDQNPVGGSCDSAERELSVEPDDVHIVPDGSKDTVSMPMDYDTQVLPADMMDDTHVGQEQHDVDEEFPLGNDVHEREDGDMGDTSKAANSKKVSERDAKARAMQEMLERRKAASGSRSGKPNPLAEAQLRAEKLRAYKASLQKSKQEKEEEDRKRIEDLKSQRKDRIAARKSHVGGSAAQSASTKQGPQTPPLGVSRSSPTKISHKLSGSSPRSSINAASVSPNVPKIKPASGNKLPRTPTGTLKANENALSRSVPSLSELKKESSKATLAVRSSTGSQRLSQLKKSLKDADSNSSPKANGHTEEKKRSLPLATVRKGIPPAKDTKGESLPVVKPTKGLTAATKQKKLAHSRGGVKVSPAKECALETEEGAAFLEKIDATNDAAVEGLIMAQDSDAGIDIQETSADIQETSTDIQETSTDIQETSTDILETSVNNDCSSLQEIDTEEHGSGYAQIRAPASNEPEVLSTANDSTHLLDESSKVELPPLTEALKVAEESQEASNVASASHAESLACSEGEHSEAEGGDTNAGEDYHAPTAYASPTDDNSVTSKDLDVRKDELRVRTELPNISLPGQYNPPRALPSDSPLHDPPKSLPRLHEAIQQAHSPELNQAVAISKKKWGESGSHKASKDHHAKGLKRLLLLGRRSNRSTAQNAADWVSVSMTSEVDDDGEGIPSSHGGNVGIRSAATNTDGIRSRADKPRRDGSSSSKGSRSFFSLSTFRGKSDGKS